MISDVGYDLNGFASTSSQIESKRKLALLNSNSNDFYQLTFTADDDEHYNNNETPLTIDNKQNVNQSDKVKRFINFCNIFFFQKKNVCCLCFLFMLICYIQC